MPDSNGLSSETVLFDLTWRDGERTQVDRLVARLAPMTSAVPVFPSYDLEKQYRVLEGVAGLSSVPVPHVRWLELNTDALGSPFFVMDRVDGQVPPDLMPYNIASWLTEATAAQRDHLQDATIQILADLHAIPDPTDRFGFLAPAGTGSRLARHVAEQWTYYEWVSAGTRQPLLERCFQWLRDHWPTEEGDAVLSWGDSRIGNIIYRDFEPVAVLDWEMATLGPPELDLGWLIFLHRFFQDVAGQFDAARTPRLPPPGRRRGTIRGPHRSHTPRPRLLHALRRVATRDHHEPHPAAGHPLRRGRATGGPRRPHHAPSDARGDARRRLLVRARARLTAPAHAEDREQE